MKLRNITSLLLAAVLLLSCFTITALAGDPPVIADTESIVSEALVTTETDPDDTQPLVTTETDPDDTQPPVTTDPMSGANQTEIPIVTDQVDVDVTTALTEGIKGKLSLTLTDDVAEGSRPELGSVVTYTVTINENVGGFCAGTFYFLPSECLEYESATLFGKGVAATVGDVPGTGIKNALGILYLSETDANYTESGTVLCTISFRVIRLGEVKTSFHSYDVRSKENLSAPLEITLTDNTAAHTVSGPPKPVITTASLRDGSVGKNYSVALECDGTEDLSWEVTSGALPKGLELLNDGTIAGVPEEAGEFTFSVTVSVQDVVFSDPKSFTLKIIEEPKKLELNDGAKYAVSAEDHLTGVTAKTTLSTLKASFKNAESVKVFKADGAEVADDTVYIGTGFTVSLMVNGEKVHTVTVVVLGDVGGDGEIGTNDYTLIRAHYLEKKALEGVYLMAARVTGNQTVGTGDYVRVRAHYLEKLDLYA